VPATQRRVTRASARILSIGVPLPGVRVDNYNIVSAPSYFDYDAIVTDTRATSNFIEAALRGEQQPQTFGGQPVTAHPDQAGDIALADLLTRRADETAAFFDRGGVAVVFAHPPLAHTISEGVRWSDDGWLGDHAPSLTPAEGTQIEVADYQHPLAAFVHAQSANISYRARLSGHHAPTDARVFARSIGGAAIGIEYAAGNGRVALLPALKSIPSGDGRYALSESLQAGIRRILGVPGEGRPPPWLSKHPLPGLPERADALKQARKDADAATAALTAAEHAHDDLARYQRLLWQEGRLGLDDAVLDALRLLGFDVFDRDPDELELRTAGTTILLEIDASDGEIGLAAHHRLRQRMERAIEKRTAAVPRGLLIINGHRHTTPADRPPQASDALRAAANQMQYAVCPTTLLYDAAVAHLNDDTTTVVTAFRDRLLTETGLLT
jgi:hypothetical protein